MWFADSSGLFVAARVTRWGSECQCLSQPSASLLALIMHELVMAPISGSSRWQLLRRVRWHNKTEQALLTASARVSQTELPSPWKSFGLLWPLSMSSQVTSPRPAPPTGGPRCIRLTLRWTVDTISTALVMMWVNSSFFRRQQDADLIVQLWTEPAAQSEPIWRASGQEEFN